MKKDWILWINFYFSVDCDAIAVDDILDIHMYLIKKHNIKCLNLFKKKLIAVI